MNIKAITNLVFCLYLHDVVIRDGVLLSRRQSINVNWLFLVGNFQHHFSGFWRLVHTKQCNRSFFVVPICYKTQS